MKRLSDEEILGRFVPIGLGSARAAGDSGLHCARLHCEHPDGAPGARAYRWAPRYARGPVIELCSRCHQELATMLGGG